MSSLVVAIDGPAGAGKSTVARGLAREYGMTYIDTGAMYRCVALLALRRGIALNDTEALGGCARSLNIQFNRVEGEQRVLLNGEDVSQEIRTGEVTQISSVVAQAPPVRDAMVALQRRMGEQGRIVMEGRDIGTVVFPDAAVKVFLTASASERARRRATELCEKTGRHVDSAQVLQQLNERDRRDEQREVAPLTPAPDAVELDTDGLTVEQVIQKIGELLPDTLRSRGPRD